MWKDILFLLIITLFGYLSFRVFFKPILVYLNKLKIENFQSQFIFDESPRTIDSSERQSAQDFVPEYQPRIPDVTMQKVNLISPDVAQYGKNMPVKISSSKGIPDAALPVIDLKDPWSISEISAAELPDPTSELCEKSATGIFLDCGVKAFNSACRFNL